MNLTIFGTGYVGLVSGVCFAEMGNTVVCVDVDLEKIDTLKQGKSPIYEPGLECMLQDNINAGRISFTSDAVKAVRDADVIFIAVGTPPEEDGSADLHYVLQVAKTIGESIESYKVIVNKSTVPVGTVDRVRHVIKSELNDRRLDIDFDVVSNPEFLKEGAAISDCMKPDRIIVGSDTDRGSLVMRQLYAPFNRNHDRLMMMDTRSAEMTKYVANAMLATKISFMNEMSQISRRLGADIEQVRRGIGADQRIGYHFIYPGCGYGGSCFPKDVKALRHMADEQGYVPRLLNAVDDVNVDQKKVLFNKINTYFQGDLTGKTIAVWGLAFKPNTDDIRDASSRVLIEMLWDAGAKVKAYDPQAMKNFTELYGERSDYQGCGSLEDALCSADALAILTEWQCFRSPDFKLIKDKLNYSVIFDGRNLYDPRVLIEHGIEYYTIGRQVVGKNSGKENLELNNELVGT